MRHSDLIGQSAIEYLMTYGWMLLVVAVVGGAVFSVVGEQSIESVQGFNSNHLDVQDFGLSEESGLMFFLSDPVGRTEVKEIRVSNPDTANVSYVLDQRVSEENTVNLPGVIPSDGGNELEVEVIYDANSLENLSTTGFVSGSMEIDEAFHDKTLIMDGLVGYWPLDRKYSDDDVVYDLTRNNNHGEMVNNPAFVEGIVGSQALEFDDRDSYVEYNKDDITDFGIDDDFTYSIWFNSNDDEEELNTLLIGFGSGPNSFGINLRSNTDIAFFGRDDNTEYIPVWTSGTEFERGETYHAVGVYEAAESTEDEISVRFYLNGELVPEESDEVDRDERVDFQTESEYVSNRGRISGGNTHSNATIIDDISIYDRAISEEEIQAIFESGN